MKNGQELSYPSIHDDYQKGAWCQNTSPAPLLLTVRPSAWHSSLCNPARARCNRRPGSTSRPSIRLMKNFPLRCPDWEGDHGFIGEGAVSLAHRASDCRRVGRNLTGSLHLIQRPLVVLLDKWRADVVFVEYLLH